MVGTGDVSFPIRLEGLADAHARFSSVSRCLYLSFSSPRALILLWSLV